MVKRDNKQNSFIFLKTNRPISTLIKVFKENLESFRRNSADMLKQVHEMEKYSILHNYVAQT